MATPFEQLLLLGPSRLGDRSTYDTEWLFSFSGKTCNSCGSPSLRWNPRSAVYTGICPTCSRVNDQEVKTELKKRDFDRECVCGCGVMLHANERQSMCTCLCECVNDDNKEDDADFEVCEAPDDDVENALTGKAIQAEAILTRQTGWKGNYTCNIGEDNERVVCYEGPGHHAMAGQHDIGLPAESSFANCENTISSLEARSLCNPLEPWELEAVHLSTGRPYQELCRIFPGIGNMDIPRLSQSEITTRRPTVTCEDCNKPRTEEWRQAMRRGRMSTCSFCGVTRRPIDPADDPDWQDFHYDVRGMLDFCLCRCCCGVTDACLGSPSLHTDPTFEVVAAEARSRPAQLQVNVTLNPGGRDNLGNNFDLNLSRYNSNIAEMEVTIGEESTGSSDGYDAEMSESEAEEMETASYGTSTRSANWERPSHAPQPTLLYRDADERARLRDWYSVPEARFSDNPDLYQATLEDVAMALEDATAAQAFKERSEALDYVSLAMDIGRRPLGSYHPFMIEASNIADELSRDVEDNEDQDMRN